MSVLALSNIIAGSFDLKTVKSGLKSVFFTHIFEI